MHAQAYRTMKVSRSKLFKQEENNMYKKLIGILLATIMSVTMAFGASAENSENNNSKRAVLEISSTAPTRNSEYTYGDFTVNNGFTMLLSNQGNYFFVKPAVGHSYVTVTLTTHLSSSQTNIDMGYYTNNTYTECNWTSSGPSWGTYTYTCTMTLTQGNYKFFISNNTANSLTFTGTTVSY